MSKFLCWIFFAVCSSCVFFLCNTDLFYFLKSLCHEKCMGAAIDHPSFKRRVPFCKKKVSAIFAEKCIFFFFCKALQPWSVGCGCSARLLQTVPLALCLYWGTDFQLEDVSMQYKCWGHHNCAPLRTIDLSDAVAAGMCILFIHKSLKRTWTVDAVSKKRQSGARE